MSEAGIADQSDNLVPRGPGQACDPLPAARLIGVSKSFGHGTSLVRALQCVDLDIHAGELTLIEGPSGSGKTTLLHILGLLQRPDEGEAYVDGQRMDNLPESRLPDERARNVALIFQGYNLLDALTAADNVALAGLLPAAAPGGGSSLTRSRPTRGGTVLLDRFGLAGRARHLPRELSGGERQRVAIARALASPGRLVLADEPTANLDWKNAQDVIKCLSELAHTERKAVVVVAHDARLEPYADRIVGLLNGRVSSDRRMDGSANDPQPTEDSGTMDKTKRTGDQVGPVSQEQRRTEAPRPELAPEVAGGPAAAARATGHRRHRVSALAWLCLLTLVVLAAVMAGRHLWPADIGPAPTGLPARAPRDFVTAAPAVVEPGTRLVALRTERQGRIQAILKRAGERVSKAEPLILLDDATAVALVDIRRADLALAQANLAKLRAWDRPEARAKVKAGLDRAQARLDRAARELERVQGLFDRSVAPETELITAIEEKRLAEASVEESKQTLSISEAGPTAEEVHVAEARVEQAESALRMARTELALHTIRSPLDGHVIYRHLEPGEVVDPESPLPILSLGNLDDIRLRAEVDEADIQRVHVGQRIEATAEAFAARTFTGRVVHLEPLMGRKTIRTERTTEQQDTKVREVIIELAPGTPPLPIDLQMTVRFLLTDAEDTTSSGDAS